MQRDVKRLAAVGVAFLGTAALSSTALADPGNGNANGNGGAPPGQQATPPGQAKKAVPPAQPAAAVAQRPAKPRTTKRKAGSTRAVGRGNRKQAERQRSAQPSGSSTGKVTLCHRTGSEKNPWVSITVSENALDAHRAHGDLIGVTSCPAGAATATPEAKAHDKVTICHRTSSQTNPYVVITIAREGWENGHSKHEGDRLLQPGDDPAVVCAPAPAQQAVGGPSAGGGCPPVQADAGGGVLHKTGSKKNPYVLISPSTNSAHYDRTKHEDDIVVSGDAVATAGGNCPGQPPGQAPTAAGSPAQPGAAPPTQPTAASPTEPTGASPTQRSVARDVAGKQGKQVTPSRSGAKPVAAKGQARDKQPEAHVLGAAKRLAGRTLPFTGLPLWVALLSGLGLLAAGTAGTWAAARVRR
jgi:hypothetical protein